MKTIHGGEKVRAGYYFNRKSWELQNAGENESLPEGEFVRVPTPALFVAAPVLGAAFAIFLPFIGLAMTAVGAGRKAVEKLGGKAKAQEAAR